MEKNQATLAKPPAASSTPPAAADQSAGAHGPVMDVKPRTPESSPGPKQSSPVQPPPEEPKADEDKKPAIDSAKLPKEDKLDSKQQDKPVRPEPPKQPGVGLAIMATVIIVLSLSALVVYAYLQSQA